MRRPARPRCSSSARQVSFASGSPTPVSTTIQPSSPGSRYACTCPGRVGSGSVTRRIPPASSSIAPNATAPCARMANICSILAAMRAEYRLEPCKSALNPVRGMPFKWSLNPYMGCVHRCTFCYVRHFEQRADRPSGRPLRALDPRQDERRRGAPRASSRAARGSARPSRSAPRPTRTSRPRAASGSRARASIELAQAWTPFSIITRGPLVVRDIDVLQEASERAEVGVDRLAPDARRGRLADDRARHGAAAQPARGGPPARGGGHRRRRRAGADPARALRPPGAARGGRARRREAAGARGVWAASSTSARACASTSSRRSRATGPSEVERLRAALRGARLPPVGDREADPRARAGSGAKAYGLSSARRKLERPAGRAAAAVDAWPSSSAQEPARSRLVESPRGR